MENTTTTTPLNTDDYRVRLDAFEGPLDLLLFLIRRNEVDVHDIPVATIAEQYLAILQDLGASRGRIDIDSAGEFLVMAATLTEIKSRMLLPDLKAAATTGTHERAPAGDPRAELVAQLLEYKRLRDAADDLEQRAAERRSKFAAGPAGIDDAELQRMLDEQADLEMEDLELIDLVEAFQKISQTVQFDRMGDHRVAYDDTPIELHAQDILSRLDELVPTGNCHIEFAAIFAGKTRSEAVGLFLALLELVRNRKVRVRQDVTEGSIVLERRAEEPAHPASQSPDVAT